MEIRSRRIPDKANAADAQWDRAIPVSYRAEEPDGSIKKGVYIRKLSDALERASKGMWINSATDYEAEVRLLERKDGGFTPFLKLYTIKDKRFSYRKEFVSSSIAPVNAALTAELATKYLKENSQILDPFCGVRTMLIERNKAVKAKEMYGLDIFGEAIEKARINAQQAGCRIQFINRDFFTFEHAYLFDEIISDLPQVTQAKAEAGDSRAVSGIFPEGAAAFEGKCGVDFVCDRAAVCGRGSATSSGVSGGRCFAQ